MTLSPTQKSKVNVKDGQIRNVVVSALLIILVVGLIGFLFVEIGLYINSILTMQYIYKILGV